ncbi:MAG: DUF1565 domain-containing protein, partial [Deltaproteobacteria bacterium]|nr:DUF1565 domain-containing protein [Deltaproteobacteria bacterium]
MRSAAMTCALLALASGCASGRAADGDIDAPGGNGGGDGPARPDAATCGGTELLPCEAIYVAKSGNDAAPGSQQAPVRSIAIAISKAGQANPKKVVFVQQGVYTESIVMSPGVSVFGGFDDLWKQNSAVKTEIVGASPAVTFEAIAEPTKLDRVTVRATDAIGLGDSSFAVAISTSVMIELSDVVIEAGIGAAGVDGTNGMIGANGSAGLTGRPGVERSGGLFCDFNPIPAGGAGGASSCGRTGG